MSRTRRPESAGIPWFVLGTVLMLSWFLLSVDLEGKSLWTDELFTARWARLPTEETIQRTAADYHPPLYFVLVNLWTRWAGHSDFALRWLSVVSAWLSAAPVYRLGRVLGGRRAGWAGVILWGLSPLVILYGRMARYYSLAAVLGLFSTCALVQALAEGKWRYWFAYILASSAALYTFYLSGLLLVAQGVLVFELRRREGLLRWLASLLLMTLTMAPWLLVVIRQIARTGGGEADLAYSIPGIAMKMAYPAYALALGESLFPWHPLAVIGGLAAALLFFLGVSRWRKRELLASLLSLLLLPFLGMILVITVVSPRTPFVSLPARTFFAVPYCFLIAGAGIGRDRLRLVGPAALALGAAWTLGLVNYYHNQQFLNPIYLTPAREIVDQVLDQLHPGDMIVSPDDSGFDYYYERSGAQQPHFQNDDLAVEYLQRNEVERVWLVALGRDQTRRSASEPIQEWLQTRFRLARSWNYVPQDPTYRAIKSHLLGRQAYEYRAILFLYTSKDQGALGTRPEFATANPRR